MESGGGGGRGSAEPSPREGDEEEEEEEEALPAEAAWSLVDGAMEAEALADLPTATIACNLDPRVFQEGPCRVRAAPPRGGAGRDGGGSPRGVGLP